MTKEDEGPAPGTPYRSAQEPGRDGFAPLLRSELTKFRTVPAWVVTLGVAGVLVVAFAWVGSPHTSACAMRPGGPPACATPSVPQVPVGPGGNAVVDTFSFLHRPMAGDGSLTVRVTSLTGRIGAATNVGPGAVAAGPAGPQPSPTRAGVVPWAKAGLLVAESTNPGAPYAAVMATPGHGVRLQDDYTGDVAGLPGRVTASSPRWLRLTRSGDVVTGYDSLDGRHWTKIGAENLAHLAHTVEVGLFVTSPTDNGSASLATATFDHLRLAGHVADSGWHHQVVGANPPRYATLPTPADAFGHAGGVFTISGSGDIAPQVSRNDLEGMGDTTTLLVGGTFGLIAVIVLATLFMSSEYRRGLICTTFSASPHRSRVLAAKAVVIGSVTFVAASVAASVAVDVSRRVLVTNGNYVFPLATATEVRVILGTGLLFAAAAVLVLSLGTILRRSAGAVAIGIALFVVPFVLTHPLGPSNWLMRVTPAAAFAIQGALPRFAQVSNAYTMGNGYYPLTPWVGFLVLGAYAAAAFGVASWLLQRRDV